MENKRIIDVLHGVLFQISTVKIQKVSDFYEGIDFIDVSTLKHEVVKEEKLVLDWILENPNINYAEIYEEELDNHELIRYIKIYLENLDYKNKQFELGNYILSKNDFLI
ncbi:MAG: hypothetical protein GQ574_08345 [Crocinitomix sp.]|nr:hypothetical protein [Crocinitomix sp.]